MSSCQRAAGLRQGTALWRRRLTLHGAMRRVPCASGGCNNRFEGFCMRASANPMHASFDKNMPHDDRFAQYINTTAIVFGTRVPQPF